jgi:hypothetical protein
MKLSCERGIEKGSSQQQTFDTTFVIPKKFGFNFFFLFGKEKKITAGK